LAYPERRNKNDVDAELDLHGLTVEQMRHALEKRWPKWRGMQRVRVIHGQGDALKPALEHWCTERGIAFERERANPGSLILLPSRRLQETIPFGVTLREKGLQLTPEQEAELRDPQAAARARQEALRRRKQEEEQRRAEAATQAANARQDEALWKAEMARLDALERKHIAPSDIRAPRILPPTQIKHQEGYWRAELVRVADTDTDTLKKQKRTGLDKLAPPLEPKPADPPAKATPARPKRDEEADRALFEAEMARLSKGPDGRNRP